MCFEVKIYFKCFVDSVQELDEHPILLIMFIGITARCTLYQIL